MLQIPHQNKLKAKCMTICNMIAQEDMKEIFVKI